MIELGYLIFLIVFTMAFWILFFLGSFIPYWATIALVQKLKPKAKFDDESDDEEVPA